MNDLKLIHEFLQELAPEVGGNAAPPLADNDRSALGELAAGHASNQTTARLEALLVESPEAMEYFAGHVRKESENDDVS